MSLETTADAVLRSAWAAAAARGVLRESPALSRRRRLVCRDGSPSRHFAHVNPEHKVKKRPSSIVETPAASVVSSGAAAAAAPAVAAVTRRPVDASAFSFCAASPGEYLAEFVMGDPGAGRPDALVVPAAAALGCGGAGAAGAAAAALHGVLINVSPILPYHSLLVPFMRELRSQVLSLDALEVALRFAALFGDPCMRLVYNSLGAWASVNHLHFHPLYTEGVFGGPRLPVEDAPRALVRSLRGGDGSCVDVYRLVDWEVGGFVLVVAAAGAEAGRGGRSSPPPLAAPLWCLVDVLLNADVPHNLVLADGGRTAVVLPRAAQAPHGARVNIAVLEAAGLGVWFDEAAYEAASGEDYAALLRAVGLGAPALDDICARAYGGAAGAE